MRTTMLKYLQSTFKTFPFFIFFILSGPAHASVVLDGTRVIYPEEKNEVSIRMTNEGGEPKLVQVWIDDGDKKASPENIRVPFVVTTPIFRIDPKKGQIAKIQYTRSLPVPSDRESVYWLNVLEIPGKPTVKEDDANYLQFRFRTRVKIFLRPKGLEGIANDAPGKLIVKYQPGKVMLENPTPYHVNISTLGVGSNADGGVVEAEMISPYTTKTFDLKRVRSSQKSPSVKYKSVNDYGGSPVWEKPTATF